MRVLSIALLLGSVALLVAVAAANWGFLNGEMSHDDDFAELYQDQGTGETVAMATSPVFNPDWIQNLQQYRNRYLIIGLVVLAVAFVLGLQSRGTEA